MKWCWQQLEFVISIYVQSLRSEVCRWGKNLCWKFKLKGQLCVYNSKSLWRFTALRRKSSLVCWIFPYSHSVYCASIWSLFKWWVLLQDLTKARQTPEPAVSAQWKAAPPTSQLGTTITAASVSFESLKCLYGFRVFCSIKTVCCRTEWLLSVF